MDYSMTDAAREVARDYDLASIRPLAQDQAVRIADAIVRRGEGAVPMDIARQRMAKVLGLNEYDHALQEAKVKELGGLGFLVLAYEGRNVTVRRAETDPVLAERFKPPTTYFCAVCQKEQSLGTHVCVPPAPRPDPASALADSFEAQRIVDLLRKAGYRLERVEEAGE